MNYRASCYCCVKRLLAGVCIGLLSLLLIGCVTPQAETKPAPPTVPWRSSHCSGDNRVEVRIASVIPATQLFVTCTREFRNGLMRVSVQFDGAFRDRLKVRTVWYGKNLKAIDQESTWAREIDLGLGATQTEIWDAPTPLGHYVRVDVSCVQC